MLAYAERTGQVWTVSFHPRALPTTTGVFAPDLRRTAGLNCGTMKLAVLADLHANLEATLSVHADIVRRGITEVWVLGDLVGKGPRPREVLGWVQENATRVVQGNWDARVAGASHRPQDLWPRTLLSAADLRYLGELPYGIEETFARQVWRFVHAGSRGVFHRLYPHSSLQEQVAAFEPNLALGLTQQAPEKRFNERRLATCTDSPL